MILFRAVTKLVKLSAPFSLSWHRFYRFCVLTSLYFSLAISCRCLICNVQYHSEDLSLYICEGTKEQLDTLTSDIKGNANVVRTKLKCESTHIVIHSYCILLQYNIKVSLQPWNKVCPEMMLSAEPQWTSGSRKLRSESAPPHTPTLYVLFNLFSI